MTQLIGRITKDAIVTTVKDEKQVVNFSIAINDRYKPKDKEAVKTVTYINCSYWMNSEVAAYLTKGTIIEVNGRIFPGAYINMQNEPVGTINCHVNTFKLYGKSASPENNEPKESANNSGKNKTKKGGKKGNQPSPEEITEPVEDLPF